jgi:hypothetical protein
LPNKRKSAPTGEIPPAYNFQKGGYEFYKHPPPSSYNLNKVLYELRHHQDLRLRFFQDSKSVAKQFQLNETEAAAFETLKDEGVDSLRSLKPHPLVDAGAHPLGTLMCLVVVQAEGRRLKAAGQLPS